MELNVAQAQKLVGEPFLFEQDETIGPLEYNGHSLVLAAPLHVEGRYAFDGKDFAVEARGSTVLRQSCALCHRRHHLNHRLLLVPCCSSHSCHRLRQSRRCHLPRY